MRRALRLTQPATAESARDDADVIGIVEWLHDCGPRRRVAVHLAVMLAYAVACLVSYRFGPARLVVVSVWPAAGVALAILLGVGPRWWPGIFAGSLAAHLIAGAAWPAALLIAVGNAATALVAAIVLRRLKFQSDLHRLRDALRLVLIGALGAPILSASLGTLAVALFSGGVHGDPGKAWAVWWSGDAIGVLLVTPFLLTWFSRVPQQLERPGWIEGWILVLSIVAVSAFLMGAPGGYEYAAFILVAWTALRFGPRGASAVVAAVAVGAVWHAHRGVGPFICAGCGEPLWQLQLYLALLTTASVMLTAMAMAHSRVTGALRVSELRFGQIFELAGVGIGVLDDHGRMVRSNRALQQMLGYSGTELAHRHVRDITETSDMAVQAPLVAAVISGHRASYVLDKQYRRKDGSYFPGHLTATRLPDTETERGYSLGIVQDVSQQHAAQVALRLDVQRREASEEALRQATYTLRTLLDGAPLPIFALDLGGRVRSWNPAAEQLFGWSADEALGQVLPIVQEEEIEPFRSAIQRVFAGVPLHGLDVRRRCRDGTLLNLRVYSAPTHAPDGTIDGLIAITEDVTERLNLGEQLRRAQKMEAVGQLAGGIAHDFNNLLTIIITNAELLAGELLDASGEARAEWAELRRAALRGAELVRKLMAFSRQRALELRPIDLDAMVRGLERTLRSLLPDSVEVEVESPPGARRTINADDGAIEQILLNLATNGRDAMEQGGTLTLTVSEAEFTEAACRSRGWGKPGMYVLLEVADTGHGMTPEVKARAFEPFFTTKGLDKGTGLGMAMVYGLVKQQQGFIELDSEPGRGTAVRLYFPAAGLAEVAGTESAPAASQPWGRGESVLVVDDEEGVRRVAARILTKFGYRVEEAVNGEDALDKLRAAAQPFALVLTDLAMPRMNGIRLYEHLRDAGRGPPVVLMSGYAPEEMAALQTASGHLTVLNKPWNTPDLLGRVREGIDKSVVADHAG
jgi:two-component system, cell cycle sensor histidine kinase and response regulator CckA